MIWSWEKANFFLLEWTLQTLAQLAECVWQKSPPVHLIFFELFETVIFQLSYIPHETLKKVQAVLKQGCSEAFNVAALDCFYRLIMHSGLLSEVLSDGGLMEQLLFELKRRAKIIRKAGVAGESFGVYSVLWIMKTRQFVLILIWGFIYRQQVRMKRRLTTMRESWPRIFWMWLQPWPCSQSGTLVGWSLFLYN